MTTARPPVPMILVVLGVVAIAAGAIVVALRSTAPPGLPEGTPAMTQAEMESIARDMRIAPFTGVDHRGNPIDESSLRGHWTVVSFGFTNCTLVCPMLHGQIFRMTEKLADRGVRFLTISVDPDHDTVEQMAAYMQPWGVKHDAWTFARVDRETVGAMLAGLKMAPIADDPSQTIELPSGGRMANILHPTRFFVVGPDGAVKGLWGGMNPDDVDALVRWMLTRAY